MGRRQHGDTRRRINLYISESILAELQIFYFDPARGKPKYGALSDIVNIALKDHLRKVKGQEEEQEEDEEEEDENDGQEEDSEHPGDVSTGT